MFSTGDTIVAIATPPGRGGLGVVRISGPAAQRVAAALRQRPGPLTPNRATFTRIPHIDEVIVTFFAAPRSYTGEDLVEISAHGSRIVLEAIVSAAISAGARLAEPGEFTLRAFLHGRLDLVQAEAVGDLIDAVTPLQARAAFDQLEGTLTRAITEIEAALFNLSARLEASLDFPDEGYHFIEPREAALAIRDVRLRIETLASDAKRGRLLREGAQVVLAGKVNVGKSSIFNNLCRADRAIVTDRPGTTRDLVSERVDIDGVPLTLVDTAGVRAAGDVVEQEGIDRARGAATIAALVLVVLDRSKPLENEDYEILQESAGRPRIIVANKSDLPQSMGGWPPEGCQPIDVSAVTGEGMDHVRASILRELGGGVEWRDPPAVSNLRHLHLLERAAASLARAEAAENEITPEEFVLSDLQQARASLEEITGRRTSDDLLRHIFERFCIGK